MISKFADTSRNRLSLRFSGTHHFHVDVNALRLYRSTGLSGLPSVMNSLMDVLDRYVRDFTRRVLRVPFPSYMFGPAEDESWIVKVKSTTSQPGRRCLLSRTHDGCACGRFEVVCTFSRVCESRQAQRQEHTSEGTRLEVATCTFRARISTQNRTLCALRSRSSAVCIQKVLQKRSR